MTPKPIKRIENIGKIKMARLTIDGLDVVGFFDYDESQKLWDKLSELIEAVNKLNEE